MNTTTIICTPKYDNKKYYKIKKMMNIGPSSLQGVQFPNMLRPLCLRRAFLISKNATKLIMIDNFNLCTH